MTTRKAQFRQALEVPNSRDVTRTWLAQGVRQVCAGRLGRRREGLDALTCHQMVGNPSTSVNFAEVLLRRGEAERALSHPARIQRQRQSL